MATMEGRRRCFIFCSVPFVLLFFLLLEGGSPQDAVALPPSSASAPAAGRAIHLEKSPVGGVVSSSKTLYAKEDEDCIDGVDALAQMQTVEQDEGSLVQHRLKQREFHDAFASWITGTQNIYTILYIDLFRSVGEKQTAVRGLAASRNIEKGEIVLAIPFQAMISLDSIERDPVLSNILSRKNREMYGWDDEMQLLIVFLLYHKALGPSSPVYPYVQILESAPTDLMPFTWTKEDLHKTYPNPTNGVRIATELIDDDVQAMYEEIIPIMARLYPDIFASKTEIEVNATETGNDVIPSSSNATEWDYSYRNFLWAFAMINSRHWRVPCEDLDRVTITEAKESTDAIESISPSEIILLTSQEAPINDEQADKKSDFKENHKSLPIMQSTSAARAHTFLLPFADLLNFGEPCTRGGYNNEKRAFEITATCNIEKGEEVTFWYTDECNDLVLANFGFTHPLIHQCKSLEEWKKHSVQLERKVEETELQLMETQEYVEYLKFALRDMETQLKQCQDLTGLNAADEQGYKRKHPDRTGALFSDKITDVLDYIIEGQKLRSSSIRRAGAPKTPEGTRNEKSMYIDPNLRQSEPDAKANQKDLTGPRLTIKDPSRLTLKSKLPLRPGLAQNSVISISLRNVIAAISDNLRSIKASQKAPIQFHISPSDLSNLAAERTLLALAEILERALDQEQNAMVNRSAGGIKLDNPGESEISDAAIKTYRIAANEEPLRDAESPDDQERLNSNIRALIQKIRFLEEKPVTENTKHQKRVTAEAAANVLATVVLKSLPTTGLDLLTNSQQIKQRQEVFGVNSIAPKQLTTFLQFCWEAVQDPVLLLLIALGIISTVVEMTLGHKPGETCPTCWIEGAAIIFAVFVVVMVTSTIGYQKQSSFVKLSQTLDVSNTKSVVRNGNVISVVDADLVVGDIINVNSHNAANIPADCVLVGSSVDSILQMDESSLTGESELVVKRPGDVILSGTAAVAGSGKVVVIAVGVNSVAGKIKASVYESAENNEELEGDEETPLFSKLSLLAKQIGMGGTAAAILSFTASLILGLAVKKDAPIKIVEYFIVAVTVLAVAVPEGLPLAVTLSLAFSSQRMTKEQNLVKHLDACETMGCATTICTDKTGTLTTNKMTARAMYLNGQDFVCSSPSISLGPMLLNSETNLAPSKELLRMIADSISINSMNESVLYFREENSKNIVTGSGGNPTECALLQLVEDIGFKYIDVRNNTRGRSDVLGMTQFLSEAKKFDFSSDRKIMSWAVPQQGGGHRIYCKGASEVILNRCTCVMLNDGEMALSDEQRIGISEALESYAQRGVRCLSLAYRDLPKGTDWDVESDNTRNADGTPANEVETNLVFLAAVGIEDPLRAEVPHAIQRCYEAGIDVRMVTGDNPHTSVSIAYQAGILRDEHFKPVAEGEKQSYILKNLKENVLLEGKTFRAKVFRTLNGKKDFDQFEFDKIWPHLRVLARSSPDDKLVLAHGLSQSSLYANKAKVRELLMEHGISIFPDRQVIAMTGDGTNDAPALKRADVGFAMGIAGTQIAKDAADIILLDDNFASIVTAAKWGRNVYASIQKFLQFQLTVNVTAVTTALVGSFVYQRTALAAIQLLWVNLLMDSLASLALASEPPDAELLRRPPVNRSEHMITGRMWVNIIGQAFYQLLVVFALLFNGPSWFNIPPGHLAKGENSVHYTLIFNSFVWMQLFNEINCRSINGGLNVFRGIFRNPLFYGVWIVTAALQVVMVEYGSYAMAVHPKGLEWKYWGISLACGVVSFPVQQFINVVYRFFESNQLLRHRGLLKINVEMLNRNISVGDKKS